MEDFNMSVNLIAVTEIIASELTKMENKPISYVFTHGYYYEKDDEYFDRYGEAVKPYGNYTTLLEDKLDIESVCINHGCACQSKDVKDVRVIDDMTYISFNKSNDILILKTRKLYRYMKKEPFKAFIFKAKNIGKTEDYDMTGLVHHVLQKTPEEIKKQDFHKLTQSEVTELSKLKPFQRALREYNKGKTLFIQEI